MYQKNTKRGIVVKNEEFCIKDDEICKDAARTTGAT